MAYKKEPLNRSITDLVAFIAFDGPDASGGAVRPNVELYQ
jgi:hypothetical protein